MWITLVAVVEIYRVPHHLYATILDEPRAERLLKASRSKSAFTYGSVAMITKAKARAKVRVTALSQIVLHQHLPTILTTRARA